MHRQRPHTFSKPATLRSARTPLAAACCALLLPAMASAQPAATTQAQPEATTQATTAAATQAAHKPEQPAPVLILPDLSPLSDAAQARERGVQAEQLPPPADPAATLLSAEWGGTGSGARKPTAMPAGQTVADQRLQRIYDAQLEFFAQLEANPQMAESARDQRAQNLISQYQSLLLDNPEYVYGYIMYGKLLRQVGQRELANKAFVKANALDPDIAVVKQQIGNYLSEEGDYDLALPYFLAAIRLSPETAVYHYQLGQLLHTYRKMFLADGKLSAPVLDKQLQDAFANAARLDPATRIYALRAAESYFDVIEPDWSRALAEWEALEQTAVSEQERQMILLQKCRVLLAMDKTEAAQSALAAVTDPSLQAARNILQEIITNPEETAGTPAPAVPATPAQGS